jgi:hypothetical protein
MANRRNHAPGYRLEARRDCGATKLTVLGQEGTPQFGRASRAPDTTGPRRLSGSCIVSLAECH